MAGANRFSLYSTVSTLASAGNSVKPGVSAGGVERWR